MAEKAPTLAEVEQESAHDTIMAVMAEAAVKPSDEKPAETTETKPAKEPDAEAPAGQERDEFGRFKAKAGDEAAAAPATEGETPAETPAVEAVAGEPEPIDPPTEWKAAEQDQFRSLPRPQQEFVLAKYNAVKEAEGKVAQTAGKYAPLEQLLAPRRAALARDGLDEVAYLQYLDRLSQSAAQDPVGFARWFAQQRGLKPEQIFGQQQQPQGQPQVADPYIAQLNQQLGQFKNYIETQQRQQQETQTRALANEISSFGTAKNDKGSLAHPYFEEVRPLMGTLLQSEQASDLESAYKMACRAHPEVSAKIASADKAQQERDRALEQRKKAEAARKAGSSISGTPGDRSAPPPSGDIREEIRMQMAAKGMIN